jgi:Phage tail assembly chaperone protein, TAC
VTRDFGEAAVRLSGAAAMLLGWRPAEFWEATPTELAAALQPLTPEAEAPDPLVMDALRRQFPDE